MDFFFLSWCVFLSFFLLVVCVCAHHSSLLTRSWHVCTRIPTLIPFFTWLCAPAIRTLALARAWQQSCLGIGTAAIMPWAGSRVVTLIDYAWTFNFWILNKVCVYYQEKKVPIHDDMWSKYNQTHKTKRCMVHSPVRIWKELTTDYYSVSRTSLDQTHRKLKKPFMTMKLNAIWWSI